MIYEPVAVSKVSLLELELKLAKRDYLLSLQCLADSHIDDRRRFEQDRYDLHKRYAKQVAKVREQKR